MLGCQVAEAENIRFGISFAVLAPLSTSSTASTFVAVANNLQSKVAMGREAGDKRRENAYDSHRLANFFLKKPGHVSAMVRTSMSDKTFTVQVSFSDSLWARIRRSHTNVG